MSYWWGQMVKKPDAKTSQEFFFLAGTNVTFTYTNNRVIINGSPGTNAVTLATNSIYAQYANTSTNWIGYLDKGIVTLPGLDPNVITVPSAHANSDNIILLTYLSPDGDSGTVQYQTIVNGVSFDIRCSRANDNVGQVSWAIFKP